jgi:23S rRNA (adenine2503-C2)-methyltransferase
VNLIDVNDARPDGYRRVTPDELKLFLNQLQILKAPIVRRYSGGKDKHAACGMLAAKVMSEDGDGQEPLTPAAL